MLKVYYELLELGFLKLELASSIKNSFRCLQQAAAVSVLKIMDEKWMDLHIHFTIQFERGKPL